MSRISGKIFRRFYAIFVERPRKLGREKTSVSNSPEATTAVQFIDSSILQQVHCEMFNCNVSYYNCKFMTILFLRGLKCIYDSKNEVDLTWAHAHHGKTSSTQN